MTEAARTLLTAFDSLGPEDQREVATEILRRAPGSGDLPEEALDELATDLLRSYDAEEAARANPSAG